MKSDLFGTRFELSQSSPVRAAPDNAVTVEYSIFNNGNVFFGDAGAFNVQFSRGATPLAPGCTGPA